MRLETRLEMCLETRLETLRKTLLEKFLEKLLEKLLEKFLTLETPDFLSRIWRLRIRISKPRNLRLRVSFLVSKVSYSNTGM